MSKSAREIPFRSDDYGCVFYLTDEQGVHTLMPDAAGNAEGQGIRFRLTREMQENVLHIGIDVAVEQATHIRACGLRVGVDCYMESYPSWKDKLFPTALRCERNGFWGCCMSPVGDMLAVASPSRIVSWKNEYNRSWGGDVGHRIYTFSVEFLQTDTTPARHPVCHAWQAGEQLHYDLYLGYVDDRAGLYAFVEQYAGITVELPPRMVLERRESDLPYGRHIVSRESQAEASVYVRHDWMYYLDAARRNADRMQQKPGTHVESWYGFYTMAAYAKATGDAAYIRSLQERFETFYNALTRVDWRGRRRMRRETFPHRLQNVSGMVSLLADLYEVTRDARYLDDADDFARWLIHLQARDGSYRSHGVHYTCVIYPAKSMLELALVARKAGRDKQARRYYDSARRAIKDLERRLDNIQTEGQMTFEDGMISCEALQLAYLATMTRGQEREALTQAAEHILRKHLCLEQKFIPDCRTFGATLRFWEARYDVNYNANMLNTPHGWTSWKTYATYYLYLLTGKREYLADTRDTMGACMQTIDENGVLRWAFVPDPSVRVDRIAPAENGGIRLEQTVVSEQYVPMVSDWYRQPQGTLPMQYIRYFAKPSTWEKDLGGSCDNDVHEHFKCLHETLFGKAFVHIEDDMQVHLLNAYADKDGYRSDDPDVTCYIVRIPSPMQVRCGGHQVTLQKGIWAVDARTGEVSEPYDAPWN